MCTVKNCETPPKARGYCNLHYKRWRKFGDPEMTLALSKMDGDNKLCSSCSRYYPLEQFHKTATGKHHMCGRCANLKRYNITLLDYESMLEKQNGVCAICKSDYPGPKDVFVVDHDHSCCPHKKRFKCGKCNRGLLCNNCNTGIGCLQESEEVILAALAYLKQ